MKKILIALVVLLVAFPVLAVEPHESTGRTVSTDPVITSISFSSPLPTNTFYPGDSIPVKWSYVAEGDVSQIKAHIKVSYLDNSGVEKGITYWQAMLTSKEKSIPLLSNAMPSGNYFVCINPTKMDGTIFTSYKGCTKFTVKNSLTSATLAITGGSLSLPETITTNAPIVPNSLDLKIVTPKFSALPVYPFSWSIWDKVFAGEPFVLTLNYNASYVKNPISDQAFVTFSKINYGLMGSKSYKKLITLYKPMGPGKPKTSTFTNSILLQKLVPGSYLVEVKFQGETASAGFEVVNKLVKDEAKSDITAQEAIGIANNPNAQGASLTMTNKLKAVLSHLEQATKLLKEMIGE